MLNLLTVLTLNIWVVLFMCGFVMGVFMTLLFVFFHKRFSPQTHNIAIVLFILSMMLLGEIAEESNLVDSYPAIIGLGNVMDLLIWPFLLFYIQHVTASGFHPNWMRLLTFIPYLTGLLWQLPVFLLSHEAQLAYYSAGISSNLLTLIIFKFLVTAAFFGYILKQINLRLKDWQSFFPKNKKAQFLRKIRGFFIGIGIMVGFIYLLFFNGYIELFQAIGSDRIGSLIISVFFYFLAAQVFRNPQLFKAHEYARQIKDFFKGTEHLYIKRLLDLMQTERPYLDEKLSVKSLAARLDLSSQQLSYLINQRLGLSFLEMVNTYRVNEVKKRIELGEHTQKTLLALALESGFNSKASFNRIFKEYTGQSPSSYTKVT